MKKSKETVTETVKVFKTLGFTEEVQSCECCGRTDLKGTIALESEETGAIVYYGVVCAAHAQGYTKKYTEEVVKASIKEATEKAKAELKAHPASIEEQAHMEKTDKELDALMKIEHTYEEWQAIIITRIEMGNKVRAVKEELKKKYLLKYL